MVDKRAGVYIFNHMVEQQARLDLVFRALGDHTRRGMLERLARGERAGLVKRTVRGRIHSVRIDPRPLARADDWLRAYERLWDTRIERLVELLRHPDNDPSNPR